MVEKTDMDDMIKMLADGPIVQRNKMINERLTMIASQPEDQRIESVRGMVLAIAKLDKNKKEDFIKAPIQQ